MTQRLRSETYSSALELSDLRSLVSDSLRFRLLAGSAKLRTGDSEAIVLDDIVEMNLS